MYYYGKTSTQRLETCDEPLILVFNEAIKRIDISILFGHRGEDRQNELFNQGFSKLRWPLSSHNRLPSGAVDCCPYPIPRNWNSSHSRDRFVYMAGVIKASAGVVGVKIRWGGDWKMNNLVRPNGWDDLAHFELID